VPTPHHVAGGADQAVADVGVAVNWHVFVSGLGPTDGWLKYDHKREIWSTTTTMADSYPFATERNARRFVSDLRLTLVEFGFSISDRYVAIELLNALLRAQ
jgi:hypothetical protein